MSKGVNNTRKVNKQAEYIAGVRKYYNIFSSKWPTYYNKKEKRIKREGGKETRRDIFKFNKSK